MKFLVFTISALLILGLNYKFCYAEENSTTTEITAGPEAPTIVGWLPRRCLWEKDSGFYCFREPKLRWYYDTEEKRCKHFVHKGKSIYSFYEII